MKPTLRLLLPLLFISNCLFSQVINEFIVDGQKAEIIVLPIDFPVDSRMQRIGTAKSGDPTFKKEANYKTQLDKVSRKAIALGGNVVLITKLNNQKLREAYSLKAEVYKVMDFSSFRDSLIVIENSYPGIILYRPNYTHSLNDLVDFTVIVDDKEYLVSRNSIHQIKIKRSGTIEITIKGSDEKIFLDYKADKTYYFRCLVYFPNTSIMPEPNTVIIPIGGYLPNIKFMNTHGQGLIESRMFKPKQ